MLKYPALLSCVLLIGWLLVRDYRRRTSVSAAVWLPTCFLLVLGSRPLSVWVWGGPGLSENELGANPLDQIFFFVVLATSLMIAILRRVMWGKLLASNIPLMALYFFFAVSVLWSGDPTGSAKRLFKVFGMLFVISVILTERDPLEAVRAVYVRCACVLLPLSLLLIKYFPNLARAFAMDGSPTYTGVTTQKNTLGENALVFTLFLLWDCLERRPPRFRWSLVQWDRLLLLSMSIWLLKISQSTTALLCMLIGSAMILRGGWLASRMINRVVVLGTLALPYIVPFTHQFSSFMAPVIEAMGRNMTFTGRSDIWAHITFETVNPIIGAGYYNFWGGRGGAAIALAMETPIPNAHSGYLDIYLDGGIIGVALLGWFLVAYGTRLTRKLVLSRYDKVRLAIFIVMVIYNLSESLFLRMSLLWFTTLLMVIDFSSCKRPAKKARRSSLEQRIVSRGELVEYVR